MQEFILNGAPHGSLASRLMEADFDPGVLRPYVEDDGHSYMCLNQHTDQPQIVTANTAATLRKQEWELLDQAIVKVARQRLGAFTDLRSRGLTYNVPNAMGKTVLQYEAQSDITDATVSIDGLRESEGDRPHYDLRNLPLPIIHKDFRFSAREIQTSRNGGSPLDTSMAELATRKVLEQVEKLTIGTVTGMTYGGGTIYGYTNFPQRITSVGLTTPTGSNGTTTVTEILEMVQAAVSANFYGPYLLYFSRGWQQFLDNDYRTQDSRTLRQRLMQIDRIQSVQTLDYLTSDYQAILVEASSNVVQAVVGMDVTTIQWETHGGLQLNFKVMAILLPRLKYDFESATGLVHATN